MPRGVEVNRPAFIDLDLVPFFDSSSLVGGIPGEEISLLAPAPRSVELSLSASKH